ncbi:MAG: Gfo/Idh/MocA family oxidoreductase [Nitrospinota bacterium]
MSDKVRMAFVGLGRWSDQLAAGARKSGRIEIAGGLSRSGEKMAAFEKNFGGRPMKSFEEILADDSIGAVILTTPNSLHAPQAIEAVRSGKHVMVEKPMALTTADCREMIAAAKEAGAVLAVGQNTRRAPRYRKAAELIREGAIGEVILAEANQSRPQSYRIEGLWRNSREESPGGPLTSFTVHQADAMNLLVGPVRRVSAFVSKLSGPGVPDDVMTAVLEFESGALGYLGGTMVTPDRNFFQVHWTGGVILVDADGGACSIKKAGADTFEGFDMPDEDAQRAISLAEEMDDFASAIQEGRKPEVAGEEGMAAVAVMEAIVRSAESGAPVEVGSL